MEREVPEVVSLVARHCTTFVQFGLSKTGVWPFIMYCVKSKLPLETIFCRLPWVNSKSYTKLNQFARVSGWYQAYEQSWPVDY